MSVLDVLGIDGNIIYVQGLDMLEGTPILDLKPHIVDKYNCPSFRKDQETDTEPVRNTGRSCRK
jgi:tRNA (Thr-GGU) A37 N-methylase